MNPPICPLHEIPMVKTFTLDGRDHFQCTKHGCSMTISRTTEEKKIKP
jgi:hypothetical protein